MEGCERAKEEIGKNFHATVLQSTSRKQSYKTLSDGGSDTTCSLLTLEPKDKRGNVKVVLW
jgi:hypothetical protein